jgi:hypothetical protein
MWWSNRSGPQFCRPPLGPQAASSVAFADTSRDTLNPAMTGTLTRTLNRTMTRGFSRTMSQTTTRAMRCTTPRAVAHAVCDAVGSSVTETPAHAVHYAVHDTLAGTLRQTMRGALRGPIAPSTRGTSLHVPVSRRRVPGRRKRAPDPKFLLKKEWMAQAKEERCPAVGRWRVAGRERFDW